MSFSNTTEQNIMALIFNATAWANMADNAASSPLTNLYVALHTADPGETGTQSTSEATYTSYARVAVARTSGGWTVASGAATNTAQVNFPACTGGSNTITHFSVGIASSGATTVIAKGALSSSLAVSTGITPTAAIGALSISLD
jgi:hypothetical protein